MNNEPTLTPAQLVEGCERQMQECRRLAGQILSPVQITALEASGLRVVPQWMIDVLMKVIHRDRDADEDRSPRATSVGKGAKENG